MPPLDEQALRRESFSEGQAIVLGDGQNWTFPRPWLRLYPIRSACGQLTVGGGLGFGQDHEDLVNQLVDCDDQDAEQRIAIQFRMASLLLARNYHLTDRDLQRLLVIDFSDPDCESRWSQINQILLGRPPKPSADGSATP